MRRASRLVKRKAATGCDVRYGTSVVRALGIAALALLAGCSQEQLVGYVCPGPGSCEREPPPSPTSECVLSLETDPVVVAQDEEFCWIYDLLPLGAPDQSIYLTQLDLAPVPNDRDQYQVSHHLDVRLVEADTFPQDEFPSGPTPCEPFFRSVGVPRPLATAPDPRGNWTFDPPLLATPSHRVLINQHLLNDFAGPVELGLEVTLHCTHERPPRISRTFTFVNNARMELLPGTAGVAESSCNFATDVDLLRLYRRTHLIDSFEVRLGDDEEDSLWTSRPNDPCRPNPGNPARCDFDEAFRVDRETVVQWTCHYFNNGDHSVAVGGSSDACALYGTYALVEEDESARDVMPCYR